MRAWAMAVVASLAACQEPRAPVARDAGPLVVVVSIDGLGRAYLDDTSHALPTLHRLMNEGAVAASVTSVWPSVTYPAHTTIVTGVSPARHGIVNNLPFDPFEKNADGWYWYAADVRVPTLWDVAARKGVDVLNVSWPVTVGANIRYNVPQFWRAKNDEDEKVLCALATPGMCEALRARGAAVPLDQRSDVERARAASALLRATRPRMAFVYLTDLDNVEHASGPMSEEAFATLERIDALLGEVIAAAREVSRYTSVVVVSDHGFVPIGRETRPNVALRRAGLVDVGADGKVRAYEAISSKAGGVAAVYARDEGARARVRAALDDLARDPDSGIARVREGAEVTALGGFPGAMFVLEASDGFLFSDRTDEPLTVPSKYKGAHGHDPARRELRTSLVMWGDGVRAGARVGDVRMVDVAPTIARLAHLELGAVEGTAIEAALE